MKWKNKKPFDKITDILFIILLAALIVPASRTAVIVAVKRVTAFAPKFINPANRETIEKDDFYWEFESIDNERINLVDFSGKTLFINEWATWCPPCIAEMPSIQKLYDQLKENSDIVFIIVTNEQRDVVEAFIENNNYSFPVMFARSSTPEAFYSPSIPTTYIVSPDGEIVLKEVGSKKWHGEDTINFINSL